MPFLKPLKFLVLLALISGAGLGCGHTQYDVQYDAYIGVGVSSADGALPVKAVPIVIPVPKVFARDSEIYQQLGNRRSVRAEYGALHVEIADLSRDTHQLKIAVCVANEGNESFKIPVKSIDFVVDTPSASLGDSALKAPPHPLAIIVWLRGYETTTEDGGRLWAPYPGEEILAEPNSIVNFDLEIPTTQFQSGRILLPLVNSTSNQKVLLEFELEYLLSFERGRY